MAEYGLFFGWGTTRAGRESAADQVFAELLEYWSHLKTQGVIEDFEVVMLSDHGGDLSGFGLVRGEREALAKIRTTQEFARLVMRAGVCVDNFGVVDAYVDGGVLRLMTAWREAIADLI